MFRSKTDSLHTLSIQLHDTVFTLSIGSIQAIQSSDYPLKYCDLL